jgi:hypothetical protein
MPTVTKKSTGRIVIVGGKTFVIGEKMKRKSPRKSKSVHAKKSAQKNKRSPRKSH